MGLDTAALRCFADSHGERAQQILWSKISSDPQISTKDKSRLFDAARRIAGGDSAEDERVGIVMMFERRARAYEKKITIDDVYREIVSGNLTVQELVNGI